jgi:mono/diheme cytochrome c family protein
MAASDSRQAQVLVQHYCTTCHSPDGDAGDEHDFTQAELLRAQHRSISARLRAHSMPPRSYLQPTAPELALLMRWADCGAEVRASSRGDHQGALERTLR